MQAKDQKISELRAAISQRDSSLQKFIKLNGSLVQNPKEEPYSKVIMQNYERAQVLQEEKIGLSEKAAALVSPTNISARYLCSHITARPTRQATGYQVARPAERRLNTIGPADALATKRFAWKHGATIVDIKYRRKYTAASSVWQPRRWRSQSRASCSHRTHHECDKCRVECTVDPVTTEDADTSAFESAKTHQRSERNTGKCTTRAGNVSRK